MTVRKYAERILTDAASRKKKLGRPRKVKRGRPKKRKKKPGPGPNTLARQGADERLEAFMRGEIPLTLADGTEHFYDPTKSRRYTLHDIATLMGVTRERIRQIELGALKKCYARFSTIARAEGLNPIEWFREVFGDFDKVGGSGFEYDVSDDS